MFNRLPLPPSKSPAPLILARRRISHWRTQPGRPAMAWPARAIILFLGLGAGLWLSPPPASAAAPIIHVVAAENFYGNIAQQLGGDRVEVQSIISDPNVDPHEYESSVPDALAISKADLVITNGLDYDTWIEKLLSASPNSHRIVLTAADLAPNRLPDNPHVWYGVDNVAAIARAISKTYVQLDGNDAKTFAVRLAAFHQSLAPIQTQEARIKALFGGTPIGLTETIGLYQTQAMGLNVLTPLEFEKAIAEGNDPPVRSVLAANQQVDNREIRILIYNLQTASAITSHMLDNAKRLGIPIVPVWETMPPGENYQSWMLIELNQMEQALKDASR